RRGARGQGEGGRLNRCQPGSERVPREQETPARASGAREEDREVHQKRQGAKEADDPEPGREEAPRVLRPERGVREGRGRVNRRGQAQERGQPVLALTPAPRKRVREEQSAEELCCVRGRENSGEDVHRRRRLSAPGEWSVARCPVPLSPPIRRVSPLSTGATSGSPRGRSTRDGEGSRVRVPRSRQHFAVRTEEVELHGVRAVLQVVEVEGRGE